MKISSLVVVLMMALMIATPAQADEHVRVIYGQRGDALIAFGGSKVRFDGSQGTYAFLCAMPPVNAAILNQWLEEAYVELDLYAGFSDCPVGCDGATAPHDERHTSFSWAVRGLTGPAGSVFPAAPAWPHALEVMVAARALCARCPLPTWQPIGDSLPCIQSTYRGVRIAIAAGGSFDRFTYDKFAAYARRVLVDPAPAPEDVAAACRLLDLVTGFKEADRVSVRRYVDLAAQVLGSEGYALAPVLDAASLSPSPALRQVLEQRASALVGTLGSPRMAELLELARLWHILGADTTASPDEIANAILSLAASVGSFYSDAASMAIPDLDSTLCALEALDLVGRIMAVDADSVRAYVLSCWISPGFTTVRLADVSAVGPVTCTTLATTYVGTEALAILENRRIP